MDYAQGGDGESGLAGVCSLFCFHEGVVLTLSDGLDMPKALPILASSLSNDFTKPPE
jgi:hypothetical protein